MTMQPSAAKWEPFAGMTERQFLACSRRIIRAIGDFVNSHLVKFGRPNGIRPEVPAWYPKCFDMYWSTAWGAVPANTAGDIETWDDAGYWVGHLKWVRARYREMIATLAKPSPFKLPRISKETAALIDREWDQAMGLGDAAPTEIASYGKFLGGDNRQIEKWEKKLDTLPEAEAISCTDRKAEGMHGPSGSPDGCLHETLATKIYLTLMIFWPDVNRLPSVRVLHQCLIQLHGPSVGELKRIEKLCQRIGLRFRGRGRPRKIWPALPHKGIGPQCTA